jgi:predicted DNA repair protein MutK
VYTPRTSDLGETSSGKKQVPKFFLGLVMTGMAFLSLFSAAALLHVVRSRHRRIQNSSFQTFIDEEYNHQAVSGQQRVEMAYRPGYN